MRLSTLESLSGQQEIPRIERLIDELNLFVEFDEREAISVAVAIFGWIYHSNRRGYIPVTQLSESAKKWYPVLEIELSRLSEIKSTWTVSVDWGEIMSKEINLNDSQRAQLLQLYKSKLQQLGDYKFFEQFDEIREECYRQIGVEDPSPIPFYVDPVTFWKPSHVKVNSFYVWRIERQTGPNPVTDYEWACDKEGEPLEFSNEEEATAKAAELNAQSNAGAILGRQGGRVKSESKSNSSRENGKRGGRPKKISQVLDIEDI